MESYKDIAQTSESGIADNNVERGHTLLIANAAVVISRLVFLLFAILTSAYCLLAYIPFTYQWVISFNLVGWLPGFVKFHPLLFMLALGTVAATLTRDLKRKETRRLAAGFLVVHGLIGIALLMYPVLPGLQNDEMSFVWAIVWLFPPLWIVAIDFTSSFKETHWGAPSRNYEGFLAATSLAALSLSFINTSLVFLRASFRDLASFTLSERLVAVGWSFASHLFLFAVLFLALVAINFVSIKSRGGAKTEFLLCHILGGVALAFVIQNVVMPAIAFNGPLAIVYSCAASCLITSSAMCLRLKLQQNSLGRIDDGIALSLKSFTLPAVSSNGGKALCVVVIAFVGWIIPANVAMRDWDFLFQKLSVMVMWPLCFGVCFKLAARGENQKRFRTFSSSLLIAGAGAYLLIVTNWLKIPGPYNGGNNSAIIERYAGCDLSLRAIRELFSSSADDREFYEYLRSYTNILPSTRVSPAEVDLVEQLKPTNANRPNIFLIVVDSLRRDYLSPYNRNVGFTPNIEQLAREGTVMKNAFTSYGGTALSEPAIWSGSMLLHKQYVLPFYPMNSLQRLIDTDRYQSFISMDPILKELLRPSKDIVSLDNRPEGHNFDLCFSLKELESRIDQRKGSQPIFVYTQPWNIHTHVIAVEGRTVAGGEEFPGFWAPYASRVKYIDACLGEFIDYLKNRGLYDNSVIILTSDHGDALGEGGRWGHSYWVYPEIIRIPLIVHLPSRMQSQLKWDTERVAFTKDITPSLYYLLGHRPIVANRIFGKPLFVETEEEHQQYLQDSYVVASSYGAAYGVLSGQGRWLFVADAVKDKEYFFDLQSQSNGNLDYFTPAVRAQHQQLIREHIGAVNELYHLKEKPQTAGAFDMGRQGRSSNE